MLFGATTEEGRQNIHSCIANVFLHYFPPDRQNRDRGAKHRQLFQLASEFLSFNIMLELLAITDSKFTACYYHPIVENCESLL